MLKLIADSGSTKTDWVLLLPESHEQQVVATFHTQGITPIHQTTSEICKILEYELHSQLASFPRAKLLNSIVLESTLMENVDIFFYGSGCTPNHVLAMQQVLKEVLSPHRVEVYSDLMAAARALCGHEAGIACILGTGANSCLYDGEHIVQNTPALGYILGDEGSGAVLGRLFINAIFKNPKLAGLRDEYLQKNKLTLSDIIQKVYREPMANRFLASTSTFIVEHVDEPLVRELVIDNFRQFFRSNIRPYQHKELPVHFVGSMAYHYRSLLEEAAHLEGYEIGQILKSPMEGLIRFHEH